MLLLKKIYHRHPPDCALIVRAHSIDFLLARLFFFVAVTDEVKADESRRIEADSAFVSNQLVIAAPQAEGGNQSEVSVGVVLLHQTNVSGEILFGRVMHEVAVWHLSYR